MRALRHGLPVCMMILVMMVGSMGPSVSSAGGAQTEGSRPTDTETGGSPSGAGLQAAAWLATLPYGAAKVGFALVGGIIGGFTYVLSGGNMDAAKSVWATTMYGTYVLTPEHLKGEKPIRFLGSPSVKSTSSGRAGQPETAPAKAAE
jgi:hypothetical protein